MQSIAEIMAPEVAVVAPTDTLHLAAQRMNDWDVGALPVCDGKRLVGMLTDRDIAIRAVAEGKSPSDVRVQDVMSDQVLWCFEDQTIEEVLKQMGGQQVRRIPVVDRNRQLVGIVSLGDLAKRHVTHTEEALEQISSPPQAHRQDTGEARRY